MKIRNVLLLASLLLIVSCMPTETSVPDYNVGREGVTIEFLEGSPPDEVYEESRLPVTIRIHNEGAADIPNRFHESEYFGNVFLGEPGTAVTPEAKVSMNFDEFYLSFADASGINEEAQEISLRGKSDIVPDGEERTVRVASLNANKVTGQRESPETQVYVSVCYPYMTRLNTDVCMDSNQAGQNLREQVCEARDLSFSAGQGAPVAIERVEVEMPPSGQDYVSPNFVIHVRNVGEGSVLRAFDAQAGSQEDLCAMRSDQSDINTLHVYAELADIELECTPEPFRLAADKGKVFCTVPPQEIRANPGLFGRSDNFVTTLNVELFYIYTSGISKQIEIQRRTSNIVEDTTQSSGSCPPHQEEVGGQCVDSCNTVGNGYRCSCTRDQCVDLIGDGRCEMTGEDLCAPGRYCCQEHVCEDFGSQDSCLESNLGCSFCDETNDCVQSCEDCDYESTEEDGVCVEVTDEEE